MVDQPDQPLPIRQESDLVGVRRAVRSLAARLSFSIVDQTKIVTAASELARNALVHGGGGEMRMQILEKPGRRGLKLVFEDFGPGIADLAMAMRDGYTSGGGLGLGMGGSRRLVNDFSVESVLGKGTKITVIRWN